MRIYSLIGRVEECLPKIFSGLKMGYDDRKIQ